MSKFRIFILVLIFLLSGCQKHTDIPLPDTTSSTSVTQNTTVEITDEDEEYINERIIKNNEYLAKKGKDKLTAEEKYFFSIGLKLYKQNIGDIPNVDLYLYDYSEYTDEVRKNRYVNVKRIKYYQTYKNLPVREAFLEVEYREIEEKQYFNILENTLVEGLKIENVNPIITEKDAIKKLKTKNTENEKKAFLVIYIDKENSEAYLAWRIWTHYYDEIDNVMYSCAEEKYINAITGELLEDVSGKGILKY